MEENNEPRRCGFYVKRKRRHCKMLPAKGNTHCAEHLCFQTDQMGIENRRISCPLDPSHTVFKERLKKHLKKCNSKNKNQEKFYEKNINSGIADYEYSENEKTSLNAVPNADIDDLIKRVRECFIKNEIKPDKCIGTHKILAKELENEDYGQSTRKHLVQQASLINLLETSKVFRANTVFIEFGAGKGRFSHWLQKAVGDIENVDFLLVDRQNHRNKFDCYHKGENQGPTFKRLHVDIEHLNLSKVDELLGKNVIAVGKHLCGAATDMSLRCLMESKLSNEQQGNAEKKQKLDVAEGRIELILFALCCFHRCSWPTYVGKDFFENNGLNAVDFHRMTMMSSWATCGFHYHVKGKSDLEVKLTEKKVDKSVNEALEDDKLSDELIYEVTNSNDMKLSSEEKKILGLQCKRLIDIGRIKYLEEHGYSAELFYYVDSDITLEDVVLFAKKR